MFWKKKSEEPRKMFKVPEQSRGAFRIAPDPNEPIVLKVGGGTEVNVLDISSGGLSFKNVNFKVDTLYDANFSLPNGVAIKTKIKILRITDNQVCPAVFIDLNPEWEDEIHRYVLIRQKEDLKNRKNQYL